MIQKKVILFFLLIQGIYSFAQVTFEKGYFITNTDEKTECFIENLDWKNTPKNFRYKLSLDGDVNTRTIENTKEFVITGVSKYKRVEAEMNISSEKLDDLTYDGKISYQKQTVFLNVLIEGKASLYMYKNSKFTTYFYSLNDTIIKSLGYKVYKTRDEKINKNAYYRQQLWTDLQCEGITLQTVEHIDYNQKDLVRFFIQYNECKNATVVNYNDKSGKSAFAISIRPGVGLGTILVNDSFENDFLIISPDVDFKNKIKYRLGLELEAFLPFNKNKFSIVFEPTYQSIKGEERFVFLQRTSSSEETEAYIDYSSLELPLSLRYNIFLNDSSRFFFNGGMQMNIPLNSKLEYLETSITDYELKIISFSPVIGIGFIINNYSIEARYSAPKNLLDSNFLASVNYSSFSLIVGYSIFNNRKKNL